MNNLLIANEQKSRRDYMLATEDEGKTVKLTHKNVAIVEAMILNDSAYLKSGNKYAKPEDKINGYKGSTAYWMSQLKAYIDNNIRNEDYYKEIIQNAVLAVDRDNNTRLNADRHGTKKGREEIIARIINFGKENIIDSLRKSNLELFKEISRKTTAGKQNKSFASKFCHYACFYLFENTEYQDNYSIFDAVLRKALPKYIKKYKINEKYNLDDYEQYRKAVDKIIDVAEEKNRERISRNGFDHLIWYYHKGR